MLNTVAIYWDFSKSGKIMDNQPELKIISFLKELIPIDCLEVPAGKSSMDLAKNILENFFKVFISNFSLFYFFLNCLVVMSYLILQAVVDAITVYKKSQSNESVAIKELKTQLVTKNLDFLMLENHLNNEKKKLQEAEEKLKNYEKSHIT